MKNGTNPNSLANLRPAKKGDIRNPNGYNGNMKLTTILKEALEKEASPGKTHADIIMESIIRECKRGNPALIKEIFDRIDGRVKQETDVTVTGNALGVIVVPSKEDITKEEE